MPAHADLRAATAADHEGVDAAFAGFDLADPRAYAAFLTAHARVLPGIEAALAGDPALPAFRPRAALLIGDLAHLGLAPPDAIDPAVPGASAGRFGMLYVIEGSRLGGGLLARRIAAGLPQAYLSAVHLPGEWRAFTHALDAAAAHDRRWIDAAIAGAKRAFTLYARAAGMAAARS